MLTDLEINSAIVQGLQFGALVWVIGLIPWAAFAGFRTVVRLGNNGAHSVYD